MLILDKKPEESHVIDLLANNAHEYKKFAIALDVDSGFAAGLCGDDNIVKLGEIIEKWIKTRSLSVTWRSIIKVVESDILGNNVELADKIRNWLETDDNFHYYAEQEN